MPQVHGIRDRSRDGKTVAEISREMNVDEKTVRKYLNQEDFSPKPPEKIVRASMLDPHKPLIDRWLEEDRQGWHKQRHTAKRIYDRLIGESPGFHCSYNIVQRYVRAARRALRITRASQIAVSRGTRLAKTTDHPIKVVTFSGEAFSEGIEGHEIEGLTIHVYSVAKTVADCFKYRNKIGTDVAIEALREALQTRTATAAEILHYADICRVRNVMMPYLESVLL